MKIEVTEDEANMLLTGLAELPAKQSFNLITKMVQQIQLLKKADQPAAPWEEPGATLPKDPTS
jgi:hypothetical protein